MPQCWHLIINHYQQRIYKELLQAMHLPVAPFLEDRYPTQSTMVGYPTSRQSLFASKPIHKHAQCLVTNLPLHPSSPISFDFWLPHWPLLWDLSSTPASATNKTTGRRIELFWSTLTPLPSSWQECQISQCTHPCLLIPPFPSSLTVLKFQISHHSKATFMSLKLKVLFLEEVVPFAIIILQEGLPLLTARKTSKAFHLTATGRVANLY